MSTTLEGAQKAIQECEYTPVFVYLLIVAGCWLYARKYKPDQVPQGEARNKMMMVVVAITAAIAVLCYYKMYWAAMVLAVLPFIGMAYRNRKAAESAPQEGMNY